MEEFLDTLLAFLVQYVAPQLPGQTVFTLGDPTTAAPTTLPFVYVVPLFDAVAPYSAGLDMDTFVVPILLVDDLNAYGPPIENVNVPGAMEQPGYRKLMQYGQIIRTELRAGGEAITVEGIAATSTIPAIRYVWAQIDSKAYRGIEIAFQAEMRTARQSSP